MTNEEAKEILKERVRIDSSLRDSVESDFDRFCENECIAIDTVLNYIENESISNDEKEVLEAYRKLKQTTGKKTGWIICDPSAMHSDYYFIPKEKVEKRMSKIENETWYIDGGEEAKRACLDELQELLGE